MVNLVYTLLTASVALNVFLGISLYRKKHVLNIDAKRLLHELTAGGAVVKIEVLDTSALFLRSPRG